MRSSRDRSEATSTARPLALRKLRRAGLLDRFHAICTSSDVARPKPAPDVYLLAAAMRSLPLGTAYAVWVGIGAIGTAILQSKWPF